MRAIVIDDERTHRDGGVHARTSREGLGLVAGVWTKQQSYGESLDSLWLDHDLGPEDTIAPVVDFLLAVASFDAPLDVSNIYVHSMNPVGADRIVQALAAYGYCVRRSDLSGFSTNPYTRA